MMDESYLETKKPLNTLDEIIHIFETREVINSLGERTMLQAEWRDTLYYLKQYQRFDSSLEYTIHRAEDVYKKYVKLMADLEENPPLTWDELKKMSGKPVWVEWIDGPWKGNSKWVLIERVAELMAIFTAIDACGVNYNGNLHNLSMGTQWKAYRKEQK